jgi:hypothetical protein
MEVRELREALSGSSEASDADGGFDFVAGSAGILRD